MNLVPVAIGATLVQSSLYDVPGGYRAVLFDRFSGVQPNVCSCSPRNVVKADVSGYWGGNTFLDSLVAASDLVRC